MDIEGHIPQYIGQIQSLVLQLIMQLLVHPHGMGVMVGRGLIVRNDEGGQRYLGSGFIRQ